MEKNGHRQAIVARRNQSAATGSMSQNQKPEPDSAIRFWLKICPQAGESAEALRFRRQPADNDPERAFRMPVVFLRQQIPGMLTAENTP